MGFGSELPLRVGENIAKVWPHVADQTGYFELRARSAFSFLEGTAEPERVAERAAELGYPALALADLGGVYGLPRFHQATQKLGVRGMLGAEIGLEGAEGHSLLILVESAKGWAALSRLITEGQANRTKSLCQVRWDQVEENVRDWTVLIRGDARLSTALLDRAKGILAPRSSQLWVDVSRSLDRSVERSTRRAIAIAEEARVPVVATGDVRIVENHDRPLLDALTCLKHKKTLDTAGQLLLRNAEFSLQRPGRMIERFADHPEWIKATQTIAERVQFTLDQLEYRFPQFPVPPGETQASHLRSLTWRGARQRYGSPLPDRARRQIEHELTVIEKLDLCGYFLIVQDIADFARREQILCQGRGSAANSAVCYALGITAVDPVGMELLFERFLSEERGEWPDIDLDLPSGDQRERTIQYVFQRYGRHNAAMTANVITYRMKMAVREIGKVLGLPPDVINRLSKEFERLDHPDQSENGEQSLQQRIQAAGFDIASPRIQALIDLIPSIHGLPRHLGQHSGGIVIAAGRLDEVVPIEPASMNGRSVVQWDKEDCADLGIIKIDLLGLGMLSALENTIPLIRQHEGIEIDLAHLPANDPKTYAMIQRADTIGVFQIESRAQMATLPRLKPKTFYDLVVEIAIIRPGPIVGQMVHPYLNRRAGREPVTYPHPSLEPILKRTLGVPIFQEQLLRIAMTAAGFTGGEAEELRRAMGFKRSTERMKHIEERLRSGMTQNGFPLDVQDNVVHQITSFALYGFPESHSASFALIAYASSYLKCHHPAAFLCGLLNAWPMGFYSPATLIQDAQRHGVTVLPIDITQSEWDCTLESESCRPPSVRIGLRFVTGLRTESGYAIEAERAEQPFLDLPDLVRRIPFRRPEIEALAELGALVHLKESPQDRRAALWQVASIERDRSSLFAGHVEQSPPPQALEKLSQLEETLVDYRLAGLTTGPQIMKHLREALDQRGFAPAQKIPFIPNHQWVRTAGHVIVRQRPGSAKGFLFLTLEDETGLTNVVLTPRQSEQFRKVLLSSKLVEVQGKIQNVDQVVHIRLRHLAPLDLSASPLPPVRNFR
ncbi:MAG: hypothetical protein CBC48_05220 [bacterium TMED88]|nr:error-prone DNA polymerase [Deltaproteobacteria bacterium]OUV34812.1 MAG: hypothetical protein CBC48_05220 [bacterium TMED88]